MQLLFFLVVACGCITISTALTYKCYNCTSMSTGPCGDRFNANDSSVHLVVAMDGQACSLTRSESKGGVSVNRRVTTDLVNDCIGGVDGCTSYDDHEITITKCCCQKERCNSVSSLRTQLLTTLLVTMGTLVMFTYQ